MTEESSLSISQAFQQRMMQIFTEQQALKQRLVQVQYSKQSYLLP